MYLLCFTDELSEVQTCGVINSPSVTQLVNERTEPQLRFDPKG